MVFQGIFERTQTTTRRPTTTTTTTTLPPPPRAPGRLFRGIIGLFNAFRGGREGGLLRPAPQTTPTARDEEELLSKQPTNITPVVDTSRANALNSLSETDLQKLIQQLEAVQKDPKNADKIDLTTLKKLKSATSHSNNRAEASNNLESVQIINPGTAGSRSRPSAGRTRGRKATSPNPVLSVTNDLYESGYVSTTLPPVRLTPVPGIPENTSPRVRGQLLNAAVNVTKAISSFFGTALQVKCQ